MASSTLRRRSLNFTAFTLALIFHIIWLAILAWIRPPPPLELPDGYVPGAPYEVFIAPGFGERSSPPAEGREDGLRTLTPRTAQAAQQQSELRGAQAPAEAATPDATPSLAPPPRPLAIPPPPSLSRPTPPSELRSTQTPELLQPEPSLPTLAAPSAPLAIQQPPDLRRPDSPSNLRSIESPVLPEPEPPLPTIAAPAPQVRVAPPPSLTARQGPPTLRPSDRLQLPEPEPPLPSLAAPSAPVRVAPPPALAGRSAPSLRAAPTPQLPAAEAPLPSLAARPPPVQVQPGPTLRGAAPAPALRALQAAPAVPGFGGVPDAFAGGPTPGGAAAPGAGGATPGSTQAARGGGSPDLHPGCSLEVLMLLTPEERVRCRNQLDALAERQRAMREAEERNRRVEQALGGPRIDTIDPSKRAYYDAVLAARDSVRNGVGRPPGLACNLGALFGGGGGAPGDKIKVPGLPCVIVPPVGVLTEEWGVSPP